MESVKAKEEAAKRHEERKAMQAAQKEERAALKLAEREERAAAKVEQQITKKVCYRNLLFKTTSKQFRGPQFPSISSIHNYLDRPTGDYGTF